MVCDNKSKKLCEYGSIRQCKNRAIWHITNGWGFDKVVCSTHKNKMLRNGSYSKIEKLFKNEEVL